MTVRVEKKDVWTIIHSRPEARSAMDPASANALYDAFIEFENSKDASVAVFWGEGFFLCRMGLKICLIIKRIGTFEIIRYSKKQRQ